MQNHHLVLAFRGGSLVVSATGDPADYTAANGAAEIACGQEVNGLLGGVGLGNTIIVGDDHIQVLYGNDSTDFVLQDQSQANTGGVENTLQSVGEPIYLDNRGVRSMSTTDQWGNWVIGTMTSDVQPWLDLQRESRATSRLVRCEFGRAISIVCGSSPGSGSSSTSGAASRKSASSTTASDENGVKIIPRVSVSAEDSDRIERIHFGAANGFVYEAERGRSFDGRAIDAFARLPLNHTGMPTQQKRFIRADLHCSVPSGQATISLSAIYHDGLVPEQGLADAEIFGGGGFWDESLYDEFVWNAPLNGFHSYELSGVGRNASLILLSNQAKEGAWTLNGISLHYSPRRGDR